MVLKSCSADLAMANKRNLSNSGKFRGLGSRSAIRAFRSLFMTASSRNRNVLDVTKHQNITVRSDFGVFDKHEQLTTVGPAEFVDYSEQSAADSDDDNPGEKELGKVIDLTR